MVPVRHAPPALASQRTPVASPAVVVTVDAVRPGVWVVRSSGDRFGGTFVCPKAALKFAREEAARFPREQPLQQSNRLVGPGIADPPIDRHAGQTLSPGKGRKLADLCAKVRNVHGRLPLLDVIER